MAQEFDINGFTNAWNTQNVEKILSFYSEDAELVVLPDQEPYRGKQQIRENVEEVTTGLEDINGDVEWSVQKGDKVSVLVHVSGKHTGEMPVTEEMKIPATNRDVRFTLGMFLELDNDGKIKREVDIADNLGILQQVGAMERLAGGQTSGGAKQAGRAR